MNAEEEKARRARCRSWLFDVRRARVAVLRRLWWALIIAPAAAACQGPRPNDSVLPEPVSSRVEVVGALSPEEPLDEPIDARSHVRHPMVARGADGFFAAWTDFRNISRQVFGARVDDDGRLRDVHGIRLSAIANGDPRLVLFDGTRFVVFLEDGHVYRVRESDGEVDAPSVGQRLPRSRRWDPAPPGGVSPPAGKGT